MIKANAKAWVAFAGAMALVGIQTALVELDLSDGQRGWLQIAQAVLVAGTSLGVWRVPNAPSSTVKP